MKKRTSLLLLLALVMGLSTFARADAPKSALVVYYSHTGATESVAQLVAASAGADLVKLELKDPYPADQDALNARITEERANGTLPELATAIDNLADYDTVYIGYPIWNGDYPPAIASFLSAHDLTGKKIAPFCTCGSSGLGETPDHIRALAQGATVLDGLTVLAADVPNAAQPVADWVAAAQ